MQLRVLRTSVFGAMAMVGSVCWSAAPLNLTHAKAAVVAYYENGEYAADLQKVAGEAAAWVQERAMWKAADEKLAIVFDIDETVLSNFPHMKAMDYGYVWPSWHAWVEEAAAPAIPEVKAVYTLARKLGVTVFFVTGRPENERDATARNLATEGMADYAALHLAQPEEKSLTSAERKLRTRRAIEASGYKIIASVGDQESDFAGGATERTFKLPNPFYHIP